jgi:hypothetical protein
MAYVYGHKRLDKNHFFYIGIGNDNKYQRANKNTQRTKYWHNITNKTQYKVEIIEDNLTWEDACEREKFWIKFYGRKDLKEGNLINLTDGGEGQLGIIRSESTRQKMRELNLGRKLSEETKQKIRESKIGKKHKPHSEETKQKIRESKIGKNRTTEQRKKMSLAHIGLHVGSKNPMFGKKMSNETKQKISIAKIGKKLSLEHREKLKEAQKKRRKNEKIGITK